MNPQVRGALPLVGENGEPTIYGTDQHHAVDQAWDDERNTQPGWLAGVQSVLGTTVHRVSRTQTCSRFADYGSAISGDLLEPVGAPRASRVPIDADNLGCAGQKNCE